MRIASLMISGLFTGCFALGASCAGQRAVDGGAAAPAGSGQTLDASGTVCVLQQQDPADETFDLVCSVPRGLAGNVRDLLTGGGVKVELADPVAPLNLKRVR